MFSLLASWVCDTCGGGEKIVEGCDVGLVVFILVNIDERFGNYRLETVEGNREAREVSIVVP